VIAQLRSSRDRRAQRGDLKEEGDPDWWAACLWTDPALYDAGNEAILREGLHALAERAPAGADLGHLGAGPIENYVTDDVERLCWIEEEARSANFRGALANAWIDLSEGTVARVEAAPRQALLRRVSQSDAG
jgi:hypothetical protein